MQIVEIRVLEGPNLFLAVPAVKIEIDSLGKPGVDENIEEASKLLDAVHDRLGLPKPERVVESLETPGHVALVFAWNRRAFAKHLADCLARKVTGETFDLDQVVAVSAELLKTRETPEDRPAMVLDRDRRAVTIAVTGTNGKTTTTRLIAHIFTSMGKRVGWSSSSGVYVAGEEVLHGDYSGPQGAARVLQDASVDVAVIETARGGILLKGIACQSFDVSVVTNVSADHLDLQGIRTVEGLARVKAVVARTTRAGGDAVLNADDPLVMAATRNIAANRFLVSMNPQNLHIPEHVGEGGRAIVADSGDLYLFEDREQQFMVDARNIPMTYGGRATFMIANALGAAAACYAGGATLGQVVDGLMTFQNNAEQNPGRLNVFDVDGATVIVDYAHNEDGLGKLLDFANALATDGSRMITIIGTAGDRNDAALREIGRLAAQRSDLVIAKGTHRYLRGRELDDLMRLYLEGVQSVEGAQYAVAEDELAALEESLSQARTGDVIAMMAQEEIPEIHQYLKSRGAIAR